jgi:hypothetical protein
MIKATDSEYAPWHRVRANDKRSARLNCISDLLSMIPYKEIPYEVPPLPNRRKRGKGVSDELVFAHSVPRSIEDVCIAASLVSLKSARPGCFALLVKSGQESNLRARGAAVGKVVRPFYPRPFFPHFFPIKF